MADGRIRIPWIATALLTLLASMGACDPDQESTEVTPQECYSDSDCKKKGLRACYFDVCVGGECGDGVCDAYPTIESKTTCPEDCATCADNVCEPGDDVRCAFECGPEDIVHAAVSDAADADTDAPDAG